MIRRFFWAYLLFAIFLPSCAAQGPASQPPPAPSQPDPVSTTATPPAQAPTQTGGKVKKIWTNDDIKGAGQVSVVGDKRNQEYHMTKSAEPGTVESYRSKLQKLQAKLDDVKKQLTAFEDFEQGKASPDSGRDVSHGYKRTPVDQQIARLTTQKGDLESQIDALFREARKNGIESGQLK